jgi:hypothetical protein
LDRLWKGFSLSVCFSLLTGFMAPFTSGNVSAESAATQPQSQPQLVVTEIAPDILGAEDYEYFEIHNNSDAALLLRNYQFLYVYTDGSYQDITLNVPDYSILPNETIVLWFNKSSKSKSDFQAHYGSQFDERKLFEFTGTGFTGMANGGNRGVKITSKAGETISLAAYLGDEVGENLVKEFKQVSGTPGMGTFRTNAPATPGTIDINQLVPKTGEPGENPKPVITHEPVASVEGNQNLIVNIQAEDDQENLTATLFYHTNEAFQMKSITMAKSTGSHYSAEIPAEEFLGDSLTYYIEVKDGTNSVTYPEDITAPVKTTVTATEDYHAQTLPKLLMTELVPNSSNISSKDGYEFIEVYNNTNQEINIQDYKLTYFTPSTNASEDWDLTEDKLVPAQSSFVVWVKNGANETVALADFNLNYGTNLSEKEVTTVQDDGMANAAEKTLIIKDDFGTEFSKATYVPADVKEDSGITYKFPKTGIDMVKVGSSVKANPGTILPGQAPLVAVKIGQDTVQPVITHSPVTEADTGTDLKIEAIVTDDVEVQTVSLSYRTAEDGAWVSLPMALTDKASNTYGATISKENLRSAAQVFYKIEATDGINVHSTEEYAVSVKKPEYDAQKVPAFLITEVVPDSTNVNGLDGYEFIEIYNNSDQPINFKDYKIRYRYPMDGPEADLTWPGVKEDIVIPSGETLVFWIINKGNTDKTVADFNSNYNTELEENKNIVKVISDGMANGSDRGIVIATNTGHEIATAYYNDEPNKKDAAANKGILYAFPSNGMNQMVKISSASEIATPGSIVVNQVPAVKVTVLEDNEPPAAEDLTNLTEVDENGSIPLLFDVKDDTEVKTVKLFYKNNEQTGYRSVNLVENYDDQMYHHTVYLPEIIGKKSIEYYLGISDGPNTIETEKTTIKISGDQQEAALRLNVQDEGILTGETIIKAASGAAGYDEIALELDGKDVTASTFKALEKPAYFAFEVKKTNLFFKNGVTVGDEILRIFDDTINSYVTMTVPIDPSKIQLDENTVISIRSGTKVSPFDTDSEENRDDFYIKNIRLVLSDGTVIYDPNYADAEKELTVGDGGAATPTYHFSFKVPEEKFSSKAYKWDTTATAEGKHVVAAREGTNSVSSTVTVDNSAPEITMSVEEGKEYKGEFTIDAQAEDRYAGVAEIKAFLDGKEIPLPLDTSSAKLPAGEHTLEITAADTVGNSGQRSARFIVVEEQPYAPKVLAPEPGATGVTIDARLSVEVKDPTNDELEVGFYQGFTYRPTDSEVKVVTNAADTEPPAVISSPGETLLNGKDLTKMDKKDGQYVTTTSTEKFPYQRFEVSVDSSVKETDTIKLEWDGKSLPGRKVSMYVWNQFAKKWEMQQWKVAGEEDFALTAEVKGKDFLRDGKIQVLIQDEIAAESASDYTLVWMSDTQYYSESYPHIYKKMVDWIAENKESLKVPYVFHTGDLVDVSTDDQQWAYADAYMKVLEDVGIPYGVLAGNHDVDHKTNDYTQYSKYFGEKRFKEQPYYGESYKDNRGHYDLVSANGNDFIMVYMGWGVDEEGIQWMNRVLKEYPDRMAILNFHEYMLVSGNRSPIGNQIFEKVVVPNKNVIATLSGHYHDSETLVDEVDDDGDGKPDRKVYQMLADYQGGPEGGQGYLRLLHVNQKDNKIYVKTYSPYLDDYNYYNSDQYPGKDEFAIDVPLQPREKEVSTDRFEVSVYSDQMIGEEQQASGDKAEVVWKNLKAGQKHSWYVRIADDYGGEVVSEVWSFTTAKEEGGQQPDPGEEPGAGSKPTPGASSVEVPAHAMEVKKEKGVIVTEILSERVKEIMGLLTPEKNALSIKLANPVANEDVKAHIPGDLFKEAAKKDFQSEVWVETETSSYRLPAKEIDILALAKKLNVDENKVELAVSINAVDGKDPAGKRKFLSEVVEFKVTAFAGEKEIPVDVFGSYVEREIKGLKNFNPKTSAAVVLNEDGSLTAVPAIFNGKSAVVKSLTNSRYAIIDNDVTFKDVNDNRDWAEAYIETLASKNIIKGKADGTFGSSQQITRAEFTALLVRALGLPGKQYDGRFKDVKGNEWFNQNNALMAAIDYGIIHGKSQDTFAPGDKITRTEAAAMIGRATKLEFLEFDQKELDTTKKLARFNDHHAIGAWAKKDVELVYQAGIMDGQTSHVFNPVGNTQRNQMAKILANFLTVAKLMNKVQ